MVVSQAELIFEEIVDGLSILKNLLGPLLGLSFIEIRLVLVNPIARVLHADYVHPQFLHQLVHQRLRQGNVLSVCMKMYHHFLALALEEEARYEIVRVVLFQVSLVSENCFLFVHLVQVFTKFILVQQVLPG